MQSKHNNKLEWTKQGHYILKNNDKQYTFNEYGNLTKIVGKNCGEIHLYYDKNHLTKIENKCGAIYLEYEQGKLCKIYDTIGRNTTYKYDGNFLTEAVAIHGGVKQYVYDKDGQITHYYNPNGIAAAINTYDEKGRIIQQEVNESGRVYFEYDEENKKTILTEKDDTQIIYNMDNQNRIIEKIYPNGSEKTSYEKFGAVLWTDRNGNTYTYENKNSMIAKTINPLGDETETEYDENGNIIKEKNAIGETRSYFYDDKGNITLFTDHDGSQTQFFYDKESNITQMILPDEITHSFQYDAKGNLLSFTDGEGCETKFQYDEANRIIKHIKPLGRLRKMLCK